jgi:uncharacterized membrane protein required for colicin V production
MTITDIGLLISLVVISLYCISAGFIIAIIDVIALIIGIWIGGLLLSPLGGVLTFINDLRLAKIIAFAIIVVIIIILNEVLTRKFKVREKIQKHVQIKQKWLDGLLAWIIGLVWGAILISAIMTVWVGLYPDMLTTTNIKDSVVLPILLNHIPVASLLPSEFHTVASYFK